jgi:hypothetical protein
MFATSKNTKEAPIGRALAVSQGCIEALEQGYECLDSLNDEQYLWSASPHVTSTIGEHFRHLLDLFHAVYNAHHATKMKGKEVSESQKVIDYDHRRRGHAVETSRQRALSEIAHFIHWLEGITQDELKASVSLSTEVSLTHTQSQLMMSTLERELTFVALHANHHFAMAKVTISLLDLKVCDDFGLAPATLSYLREQ